MNRYKDLGIIKTADDLIKLLEKHKNFSVSSAGTDCHVMINESLGYFIFDDNDYAEEWNTEE